MASRSAQELSDTELVERIKSHAAKVGDGASSLSSKIETFEVWLKGLPGKVAASTWTRADEDDPSRLFGVRFARERGWELLYSYVVLPNGTIDPDECAEWNSLSDASLEAKMQAVGLFKGLLQAIYGNLVSRELGLRLVNAEFNSFAKSIGLDTKQEGNDEVPF